MMDSLIQNPLPKLTPREKKRLAIGAVGVAALLGVAVYVGRKGGPLRPEPPKDYGIPVDQLCVNATVTDHERLRRTVEDTYDTEVDKGVLDPFAMTTAFFQRIAPHCYVYPRQARSPKEAEFFLTVFTAFLEQLEVDDLITEDESRAKVFEAMAWASRSGWKPTQAIESFFGGGQ